MKRCVVLFLLLGLCCTAGCAIQNQKIQGPGLLGQRMFVKARPGMTQAEVEEAIGLPQRRSINVSYKGKAYDEVWLYGTMPPTVLYFKNGVLEEKDYQY